MSSYADGLQQRSGQGPDLCELGRVLDVKGQEEYDSVVEAIHAKDEKGKYYPANWVVEELKEYGWSTHLIRRHRAGECKSCRNRLTQNS